MTGGRWLAVGVVNIILTASGERPVIGFDGIS
jgi:hypothetical protein